MNVNSQLLKLYILPCRVFAVVMRRNIILMLCLFTVLSARVLIMPNSMRSTRKMTLSWLPLIIE